MTAADGIHAAAHAALLFAPGAAVIVGGIPGAGKTTFLARTVRPGDARVLDSAQVRRRLRARFGRRVPYALYRPLVHALHLLRVWRALAGAQPVVVHDCPRPTRSRRCGSAVLVSLRARRRVGRAARRPPPRRRP